MNRDWLSLFIGSLAQATSVVDSLLKTSLLCSVIKVSTIILLHRPT